MKKTTAVLMALILTASICACGTNTTESGKESAGTNSGDSASFSENVESDAVSQEGDFPAESIEDEEQETDEYFDNGDDLSEVPESIAFSESLADELALPAIFHCIEGNLDEWVPDVEDSAVFWDVMSFYCSFTDWISNQEFPRMGEDGAYRVVPVDILKNAAYAIYSGFDGNLPVIGDDVWRAQEADQETVGLVIGDNAPFQVTGRTYNTNVDGSVDAEYVIENWGGMPAGSFTVHFEPNPFYDMITDYVSYYYRVTKVGRTDLSSVEDDKDIISSTEEIPGNENTVLPVETPESFSFSSGAGAWSTELDLSKDGSFNGYYHDTEASEQKVYYCDFYGAFGNIHKINEYTWSMKLTELYTQTTEGEETVRDDGFVMVGSDPYGLDDGGEQYLLYLPQTPISELNEEVLGWVRPFINTDNQTTLGCTVIYDVDGSGHYAFVGFPEDNN